MNRHLALLCWILTAALALVGVLVSMVQLYSMSVERTMSLY